MFYAIEFFDGCNTTIGAANRKTGRLSIACHIHAFNTKIERAMFLERCQRKCKAVGRSGIRQYKLGLSVDTFNEWLFYLESQA